MSAPPVMYVRTAVTWELPDILSVPWVMYVRRVTWELEQIGARKSKVMKVAAPEGTIHVH